MDHKLSMFKMDHLVTPYTNGPLGHTPHPQRINPSTPGYFEDWRDDNMLEMDHLVTRDTLKRITGVPRS